MRQICTVIDLGDEAHGFILGCNDYFRLLRMEDDPEVIASSGTPEEVVEFCSRFANTDIQESLGVTFDMTAEGLLITSNGSPDVHFLSGFISGVMDRFEIDGAVVIPWATISDPPEVDGVGGGVALITRGEVRIRETHHLAEEMLNDATARTKKWMSIEEFRAIPAERRAGMCRDADIGFTDVAREALEELWLKHTRWTDEDIETVMLDGFRGIRERSDAALADELLVRDPECDFSAAPAPRMC